MRLVDAHLCYNPEVMAGNRRAKYKVVIKRDVCIGAATCVAIAPGTYKLDEEDKAVVIDQAGDDPEEILLAAQGCPSSAIYIYDNETGELVYPKQSSA